MIYVSTACIKLEKISESVKFLAEQGFKNIELSGGTEYYPEFERDLVKLKEKYLLIKNLSKKMTLKENIIINRKKENIILIIKN